MDNLTINGYNIFYKDLNRDQEESILLIHGHPFDHTMWNDQLNSLRDFRLILPDLKGYGKSDYKFEKIFIEDQARDLSQLLEFLNIKKVHLIGLSMGGEIMVEFQRLFPHKVLSMILCASIPKGESEESKETRLKLADSIDFYGMLYYTKKNIHQYINMDIIRKTSDIYQHCFKMMTGTKTEGVVASHRGRVDRRDHMDYLSEIEIPVLVIAGEKDYFFEVEDVQQSAKLIQNSNFEVIANSGHLPNIEKPKLFNELIVEFYKKQK